MGDVGVHLEGAARLRRTLKAAGGDLSDLKEAHRHAAQYIMPAAVAGAPKLYGALAATLRVTANATGSRIRAGNRNKKEGVPYAGVIHWGWPERKIRAQPWITQAAQETEPLWIKAYEAEMHAAIRSIAGK